MTIEAMRQALEALENTTPTGFNMERDKQFYAAITALRTAIEQAEEQEAWKTSDTAYRPNGLPQDFIKHEVDSFDDWSEWVCPDPTQYFMKCCGCGLVHKMQFKVVKYSEGDECEPYNDPNVQVVFRARRHEVAEKQEDSLAQTNWDNIPQAFNDWWNADYDDSTNPFRLNSPAYWAWSGWSAANKENTTPPAAQRTWVGLTDEEIFSVLGNLQRKYNGPPTEDSRVVFALAIEAKLKEKNT